MKLLIEKLHQTTTQTFRIKKQLDMIILVILDVYYHNFLLHFFPFNQMKLCGSGSGRVARETQTWVADVARGETVFSVCEGSTSHRHEVPSGRPKGTKFPLQQAPRLSPNTYLSSAHVAVVYMVSHRWPLLLPMWSIAI